MQMQFLATALTQEEKTFLGDQIKSEHFRVYQKAITYLWSLEAAKMVHADSGTLPIFQGVCRGLLLAKNLICLGTIQKDNT